MPDRKLVTIGVVLCGAMRVWALDPNEILVVANSNYAPSMQLARYYCRARGLPSGYVVPVALGAKPRDAISRSDYENRLAKPLYRLFSTRPGLAHIRCLVTTYGVPFKVGTRGPFEQLALRSRRSRAGPPGRGPRASRTA